MQVHFILAIHGHQVYLPTSSNFFLLPVAKKTLLGVAMTATVRCRMLCGREPAARLYTATREVLWISMNITGTRWKRLLEEKVSVTGRYDNIRTYVLF